MPSRLRLILDTSVFVAALRSRSGASRELLGLVLAGNFDLLLSPAMVFEYEAVLLRPEQLHASNLVREDVLSLISRLLDAGIEVRPLPFAGPYPSDPDDTLVLSLAFSGHADGLVTHNLRHFREPCRILGVSLYSPGQFLAHLRG